MKTVKEAIVDKKNEILNGLNKTKDGLSWNETSELINELIELTQSWITVEQELPEPKNPNDELSDYTISTIVLIKDEHGYYWLGYYDHSIREWLSYETDAIIYQVVAWRPIELK